METKVKTKLKDSIFTFMFSKPEYSVDLCRSLIPGCENIKESDIKVITLNNIVTIGQYNDLGLLVRNNIVTLVEAQSTLPVNLGLRLFLYAADTYKRILSDFEYKHLIYSETKLVVPSLYSFVVYTGVKPCVTNLNIKDNFLNKVGPDFNFNVYSKEHMSSSVLLNEYINFCITMDEGRRKGYKDRELINYVKLTCGTNSKIIKDIIDKYNQEVFNMFLEWESEESLRDITLHLLKDQAEREVREELVPKLRKELEEEVKEQAMKEVKEQAMKEAREQFNYSLNQRYIVKAKELVRKNGYGFDDIKELYDEEVAVAVFGESSNKLGNSKSLSGITYK